MDVMEEVFIEDDLNILDILEFRFPKKTYNLHTLYILSTIFSEKA